MLWSKMILTTCVHDEDLIQRVQETGDMDGAATPRDARPVLPQGLWTYDQ